MSEDKTEPNTIRALAQELASFERRQEARTELLLNEMRRHGQAIAEIGKQLADLNARVDTHDRWEREGCGADNGSAG